MIKAWRHNLHKTHTIRAKKVSTDMMNLRPGERRLPSPRHTSSLCQAKASGKPIEVERLERRVAGADAVRKLSQRLAQRRHPELVPGRLADVRAIALDHLQIILLG